MNKVAEKEIKRSLEEKYEYVKDYFSEDNLLGIFSIGKANYGFLSDIEDLEAIVVYIPTFEELCIASPFEHYIDEIQTKVVDIRNMYFAGSNYEDTSLELLFAQYIILNPFYEECFIKNLYENREIISHYNAKVRLEKAYSRALTAIANKDYFEAYRLWVSAKNYERGLPCEECFLIKDPIIENILWNILNNVFIPDKDEILLNLSKIKVNAKDELNEIADKTVKKGIVELIHLSLELGVEIEPFKKSMTTIERKAFSHIRKKIQDEGLVSFAKMSEESKISRTVYANLLVKMERFNIAKIEKHGVKGTYIKFLIKASQLDNEEIF